MKEVPKNQRKVRSVVKRLRRSPLALAVVGLCLGLAPSAFAVPVDLGGAADYAVVGVGGSVSIYSDFEIYQSATVINGNVAEGPYTHTTHGVDATVNGRWDYDPTVDPAPFLGSGGSVTGGFVQKDLTGVAADARNASALAAALAPTQNFSTLTEGQTIVGNGGLNVIRITGDVTLKKTLTISGSASDQFVFQLTTSGTGHILTLSGMTMTLAGGVLADSILWNLNGLGGDIVISSGADVAGTFLAPDRQIVSDHGTIDGRLIGGGSGTEMSVHSGSQIGTTTTTTTVPDGGATVALLGTVLVGLVGLKRKAVV